MKKPNKKDLEFAEFLRKKEIEYQAAIPTATPEERAELERKLVVCRVERRHIVGLDDAIPFDAILGKKK